MWVISDLSTDPTPAPASTHIRSVTYSKLLRSHFQDIEDNGVIALAGIVAALALQRVGAAAALQGEKVPPECRADSRVTDSHTSPLRRRE